MARVPSIKGAVFAGVVEAVRKLLESGELTREQAARRLDPADLPLLDAPVSIAGWYPISAFNRMSELMRDLVGGGNNDYLRELGRESARRLIAAGLYSQFEYLHRITALKEKDPKTRSEAFARDLRRLTTMSGSIYNFGVWTIEADPDYSLRHRIVVSDAAAFSDVVCCRAEGFINQMGHVRKSTDLWKWTRIGRDVVQFRMTREV
ncbi:MAG TPA: hypothetical protein VMS55_23485 [Myxococcota bacterium]|nr:hypothetical protein [Myxococcota bacterium]